MSTGFGVEVVRAAIYAATWKMIRSVFAASRGRRCAGSIRCFATFADEYFVRGFMLFKMFNSMA